MTLKQLKEIIAFRGNITASELARIHRARQRNKERFKRGIAIEPSMSRAIAEMAERYPTHSKD